MGRINGFVPDFSPDYIELKALLEEDRLFPSNPHHNEVVENIVEIAMRNQNTSENMLRGLAFNSINAYSANPAYNKVTKALQIILGHT